MSKIKYNYELLKIICKDVILLNDYSSYKINRDTIIKGKCVTLNCDNFFNRAQKQKENIFLKQSSAKNLGFLYEIWVYNAKGERVECII